MDKPFTTDRCTLSRDLDAEMIKACIRHDWAYWKGGDRRMRLVADLEFALAIAKRSKHWRRAVIRFVAVRLFAGPFFPLPHARWGYGWNWPRWKPKKGQRSKYSEASQRKELGAANDLSI